MIGSVNDFGLQEEREVEPVHVLHPKQPDGKHGCWNNHPQVLNELLNFVEIKIAK